MPERPPAGPPAAEALQVGAAVHGSIDWQRRFDHMQQHTGQHVLSAAIDAVRRAHGQLPPRCGDGDHRRGARADGSGDDRGRRRSQPHRVGGPAGGDPLRVSRRGRATAAAQGILREGTLRLVDVHGFDLSACGGTHVSRTGAIGVIVVAAWERFKGGQRVEFLCGGRALRHFRVLRDATTGSLRLLSVMPDGLPAAIERLQGEARDQKKAIAALHSASWRPFGARGAGE